MTEPESAPNPSHSRALLASNRIHSLLLSTTTLGMVTVSDAAPLVQQLREDTQEVLSFCFAIEDELEKEGLAAWGMKLEC